MTVPEHKYHQLTATLGKNKLRLSYQRMKILDYLTHNLNHPTADQIYLALHREIPTLSRTTVYNSLNMLEKAGLVNPIGIEEKEKRYDIVVEPHGHFKCERCGKIIDFELPFTVETIPALEKFEIHSFNVFCKGICDSCRQETAEKQQDSRVS